MKDLYSYDIFDTCLVRACGTPDCISDIVARRILEEPSLSAINDFILIRKKGEGRARELFITSEKEDITLADIYSQCDFSSITDASLNAIMEMEMMVEEEMLTPVLSIKEEIEHIHSLQQSVIFISDMYLPDVFIKKILIKTGLFVEGDKLFISGSVGKTKSTGNLFLHVQKILKADVRHWYHKGDSRHSDYDMPRSIGIKVTLVNNEKSYYEKKALEYNTSLSTLDIAKISNLSRAIRLSFPDTSHHRFAADFIAPLMTTFVHSIFKDAQNHQIKHLYFIARDAYILYIIAQQLNELYPEISIHYFYASRQSLYLPGLENLSKEAVKDILPNNTTEDYEHIKKMYQEQEQQCITYFDQEGLTRPGCAIVDMVGSRRCQISINNILKRNGFKEVYAYYFEVTPFRVFAHDAYTAMYYQEKVAGSPNYHHASHPLFEQYFGITDQLRTIGYKKDTSKTVPVFEEDLMKDSYKRHVSSINQLVCQKYAHYYSLNYLNNPNLYNSIFYRVFALFCHVPRREYLMALNCFFSTSSATTKESLLEKRNYFDILFNKRHFFRWKQGNLIYNSGILYKPTLALLNWYYQRKENANRV